MIIQDWRGALKGYSTMALAFIVAAPTVWAEMPPEVVALIPEAYLSKIVTGVAVAGLIGRFIAQGRRNA